MQATGTMWPLARETAAFRGLMRGRAQRETPGELAGGVHSEKGYCRMKCARRV
jgi:hypothetical protein